MAASGIIIAKNWHCQKHQYTAIDLSTEDAQFQFIVKIREQYYNGLEILPEGVVRKCYFDFEILTKDRIDAHELKRSIIAVFRKILQIDLTEEKIKTWTSSLDYRLEYQGKESFHFIIQYQCPPSLNKKLAEELNKECRYQGFDTSVYSKMQCFRLPYSSKPESGIKNSDPHRRRKIPYDYATGYSLEENEEQLVAALITHEADKLPRLHLPHGSKNPKLTWFKAVLEDQRFQEVWKEKANEYGSRWTVMGFTLYFEGNLHGENEEAARLFGLFCEYGNEWNAERAQQKFYAEGPSAKGSQFKTIRLWLSATPKYRKAVKEYDSLLSTEVHQEPPPQAPHIDSEKDIIEEDLDTNQREFDPFNLIFPYNSAQFRMCRHFKMPRIRQLWRQELRNERDISKLLPLLQYQSPEESKHWKQYEERKLLMANSYGNLIEPFPDPSEGGELFGILVSILTCYEIPYDAANVSAISLEAYEEKSATEAFGIYMKKAQDLESYDVGQVEELIKLAQVYPVLSHEEVLPWKRFQHWLQMIKDDCVLWANQIPYRSILEQFIAASVKGNEHMIFAAFAESFSADRVFHYFCSACHDSAAAQILYSLYPYWAYSEMQQFYVYDYAQGFWTNDEKVMLRTISAYQSFLTNRNLDKWPNYGNTTHLKNKLLAEMKTCAKVMDNKINLHSDAERTRSKLLFPNGYYDGEKGAFQEKMKIETPIGIREMFAWPELAFMCAIPDPYVPLNKDLCEELKALRDTLFITQHGEEVGTYYIEVMASALFGTLQKTANAHIGTGNNGKSTELAFMRAAFGNYVGEFELHDWIVQGGDRTREIALKNACAYDNWFKRILITSEGIGPNLKIDNSIFKAHTSGGLDPVKTRHLHKNHVMVVPLYALFMYVNTLWNWADPSDEALKNRMNFFEWNKEFTRTVTDPNCQLLENPQIRGWPADQLKRQLYVHIMLEAFKNIVARNMQLLEKPEKVRIASTVNLDLVESVGDKFEKVMFEVEFTGNPEHFLLTEELKNICQTKNWNFNAINNSISTVIATLQVSGSDKTIFRAKKKVRGQTQNCMIGAQVRASVSDAESNNFLTDYEQWKKIMEMYKMNIPPEVIRDLKHVAYLVTRPHSYTYSENEVELLDKYATASQLKQIAHPAKKQRISFE